MSWLFPFMLGAIQAVASAAEFDLKTATLSVSETSAATLKFADGTVWGSEAQPAIALEADKKVVRSNSAKLLDENGVRRLRFGFEDGSEAVFRIDTGEGFAVFRLEKLDTKTKPEKFRPFLFVIPNDATYAGVLNAATHAGKFVGLILAEINMKHHLGNDGHGKALVLESWAEFGIEPIVFGLVACPETKASEAIPAFEVAAGLPSPRFDGVWNKIAPQTKRSYFFLTYFHEKQFDDALAIARRGNFERILILQNSWCKTPGHYEVNDKNFSGGLPGLQAIIKRFNDAGFKVGFHLLGASIDPPDSFLVPKPEDRLLYGPEIELAEAVDGKTAFLPTPTAPTAFPKEDGGYEGSGTVLRVGDELIKYEKPSLESPFGFTNCKRGHLGTVVTSHPKGEKVRQLYRAYGYHQFDIDSTLFDEVATNLAKTVNACNVEMLYFDGSEWLQGNRSNDDHWFYNPKLLKGFYDKLANKNIFIQASSFTPYSWHIIARTASADGHGDLKGYLDERSPAFGSYMARNLLPLDIGWYYGYDTDSTLDMYEYILGATIGYDSSLSFQVSVDAAQKHPFTLPILDMIRRFEKLRLSGRVPEEMKQRLHIDPALGGKQEPEARQRKLSLRREYRLLGDEGKEVFQRVVYSPWFDVDATGSATFSVEIPEGASVGVQLHVKDGAEALEGGTFELAGQTITTPTSCAKGEYVFLWPGEPVTKYSPGNEPSLHAPGPAVPILSGKHDVKFHAAKSWTGKARVRLSFQPPERYEIP